MWNAEFGTAAHGRAGYGPKDGMRNYGVPSGQPFDRVHSAGTPLKSRAAGAHQFRIPHSAFVGHQMKPVFDILSKTSGVRD